MKRLTYIFFIAVILLAITLFAHMLTKPQSSTLDEATLNPMIEKYLLANPSILQTMADALQNEQQAQQLEQSSVALVKLYDEIYNDPDNIVLGNPDGDVTLVEFFDYNCPFCKQVMPHIPALIDADPNLRIIFKEFPILGEDSIDATRISIAMYKMGANYWEFHERLYTERGKINNQKALNIAKDMGVLITELEKLAASDDVTRIIQNSYAIAQALNINGTPAFIIGNEIIPGAVELEGLQVRIENMRKCGKAQC